MAMTAAEKQRVYRERKRLERIGGVGEIAAYPSVVAGPGSSVAGSFQKVDAAARDVRLDLALAEAEALWRLVDEGYMARTVQPSVRRAYQVRFQALRALLTER